MKRLVKYIALAPLMAFLGIVAIVTPALAISAPSDTPSVESVWAWRNVLETGDMFVMVYEDTPYSSIPTDYTYSQAFVWRMMNGSTELAESVGYDYNDSGYGYNVIGFYFDAASAPSWAGAYTLTLSENPAAFSSPTSWNMPIPAGAYSSITDSADAQADIAAEVISIAGDLYSQWGLSSTTTLLQQSDVAQTLSLAGQSFFRGAIYGIQGLAPAAFPSVVTGFTLTDTTWTSTYADALAAQNAGNPIDTGITAGEQFLDVNYNLMGLLIALIICAAILFGNWYLAGGDAWRYTPDMVAAGVVLTRMGMVGLGELALIGAVCALYANYRVWRPW